VSGFYSILFGNSFSTYQSNLDYYVNSVGPYNETALEYKDDVYAKYQIAKNLYDKNLSDYKKTSRDSGTEEIEALISQTYDTVKAISDAAKSANNLIQYYQEKIEGKGLTPVALSDTHLASAQSYMSKANSYSSSLLSVKNTIQNSKESLIEIDFDIADQEKQVKKAEDALINAKEDLNDYSIFSPSSGVITVLNVEKDGSVSSGANLMTLAANQKIAEITLNEVDVANVKVGQKTNLTFDAIDDLNITGTVSEIDTTGTVSQGVVSYGVTIIFDMQDERVKSGMTVSATIITEVKQNVLVVASSAIKTSGGISYVEVLSDVDILSGASSTGVIAKILPTQQTVTVGLSDDIFVEITSGLKEGDLIVAKTTTSASKSSSSNNSQTQGSGANSLLQAVSGGTGARMPSGGPGF
jgi:HlyD family secretion protein